MTTRLLTSFATFLLFSALMVYVSDASARCRDDVNWTGLSGTSASGTTITKTGGSNGSWDAGAYDLTPVGPGGYVQFRAGDVNKYKMLGLNSDYAANNSYSSIDYCWYTRASGDLYIYENGSSRNIGTPSYSTTDVFRIYWNPFNNKIEYYRNGVLEYTSTITPSATLYVDLSIHGTGGSFTDVTVAGGDCQECASPVVWSGIGGGASASGSTISKTGGTANSWSSGAYSMLPVTAGGFVQFQAGQTGTAKMIGLNSDPATDHNWNTIDYAWYPYGSATVRQNGTGTTYYNSGSYSTSDRFMIYWNPTNNRIEYYKNKVLLYTSTVIPSGTYYVDISLYHSNASFTNVVVQGGDCSYSKDWF